MRMHFRERDELLQQAGFAMKPYLRVVLDDLGIQGPLPWKAEMTFQVYAAKKRDDDNCVVARKIGLDTMKKLGFIADDDPAHVRSIDLPCEVDKSRPRTVITIKPFGG
jgi:Holliday junction resolvase RusA-like endonuclease